MFKQYFKTLIDYFLLNLKSVVDYAAMRFTPRPKAVTVTLLGYRMTHAVDGTQDPVAIGNVARNGRIIIQSQILMTVKRVELTNHEGVLLVSAAQGPMSLIGSQAPIALTPAVIEHIFPHTIKPGTHIELTLA